MRSSLFSGDDVDIRPFPPFLSVSLSHTHTHAVANAIANAINRPRSDSQNMQRADRPNNRPNDHHAEDLLLSFVPSTESRKHNILPIGQGYHAVLGNSKHSTKKYVTKWSSEKIICPLPPFLLLNGIRRHRQTAEWTAPGIGYRGMGGALR